MSRIPSLPIGKKLLHTDSPHAGPPGVQTEIQASTEVFTYFTKAGETNLLHAAINWTKIRLRLENAGPVAVGNKQSLTPVLSGAGALLPTGEEVEITLPKGTRLYIAAESINRVAITLEPVPWGEIILMRVTDVWKALTSR